MGVRDDFVADSRKQQLQNFAIDAFTEIHGDGWKESEEVHELVLTAIDFGVNYACLALGVPPTYEEEYQALLEKLREQRREERPVNKVIFKTARELCRNHVEESPEALELYAERDRVLEEIRGKVSREAYDDVESMISRAWIVYGNAMFEAGFDLGQNPGSVFDLPCEDLGAVAISSYGL